MRAKKYLPRERQGRAAAPAYHPALPDQTPWAAVLMTIIRRHNWSHAVRDKGVSHKTMAVRQTFLFAFFRELRLNGEVPYRVDPRRLGNRHIRFMVQRWLDRELSPATLQQYLSFLRTYAGWIGKPQLVMPVERYINDPKRTRRRYCAEVDKSWSARGIDAEQIFTAMAAIDRYAAAQLAVKSAFGLRRKEAVMLQPQRRVVTARQAGIAEDDDALYLDLLKGTKGGRQRYLPIDSDDKRRALQRACELVRSLEDHLGNPARTLKQNLRRIDYVMAKLGLTQSELGVTGHGLRHDFANDLYEKESGATAPLRGGAVVDSATDQAARLAVARQLGHGRIQIAGAYLGGRKRIGAKGSPSGSNE
ncbi:integrase domain-containing protein [Actimicrobium sp. CCI2.3]|uniref:integrase domain-containing protein n=1 Tax=Actimicrobium sp. CCI2.3 TaxID=3048616 RepID=UPI002AB5B66A|nr:integrase domain-containing protein [Actimicrobium sp. CCI2.3]MDY7574480.1 integrase domain-containing protein [Actimicrobium sp. CCI2.3]MEB0023907.1 integrase domain-containing protein [Actimicrobium sp. CCI2.3]